MYSRLSFLIICFLTLMFIHSTANAACSNNEDGEAGQTGEIEYFNGDDFLRYCDGTNWIDMNIPATTGCENVGDVCTNGSVYAGISPDKSYLMYTTPADQGIVPWNNGNTSGTYTTILSPFCTTNGPGSTTSTCVQGEINTSIIAPEDADSSVGGFQPHQAAVACDSLIAHGRDDWYLPSMEELWILYDNRTAIGGFTLDRYWSSSEETSFSAKRINFNGGAPSDTNKRLAESVRCVRKDPIPYVANPVEFDGVNDFLRETSIGGSNSSLISGSLWFKRDPDNINTTQVLVYNRGSSAGYFRLRFNSSNFLVIDGRDSSGGGFVTLVDTNQNFTDGRWHHVAFSIDSNDRTTDQIYIDDVDDTDSTSTTITSFGTGDGVTIGAFNIGSDRFYGQLADLWVDFDTKIDFSVEANRRKFITADGKPVYLGGDGSLATGTSPEIFLSGDTSTWHTNDGAYPGFTENGALADGVGPVQLDAPFAYWKLDETTATTTAIDSTGNGNDATYTSVSPSTASETAIRNTGINFIGNTNARAEILSSSSFAALDEFTISAWTRADAFSNHMGIVGIGNDATGAGVASLFYRFNTNDLNFTLPAWTGNRGAWRLSDVGVAGEWIHILVTYSYNDPVGTPPRFYINGEERTGLTLTFTPSGTYSPPATVYVNVGNALIGGTLGRNFHGALDEVLIYDRILTAAEIEVLGKCSGPGVYYYNAPADVMQWCKEAGSPINMHEPAGGFGGCTSPTASAGALNFDTDRFKACDGNGWLDIGK